MAAGRLSREASAFFLPLDGTARFCLYHAPAEGPRHGLVYVHPFGEEMNKARRMASLQAARLSAAGCAVLQIDLHGCGDSEGEFRDARWSSWRRDVRAAVAWLKARTAGPVGLWGLRLGATLAADAAQDPALGIEHLLLWQPVANGEQFLTQFLRAQLAYEMLAGGAAQTRVAALRAALERGETLEIGGYELNPELAAAIDALKLADLAPAVRHAQWLEVSSQAEPRITPASERVVDAWRGRGPAVEAAAVPGDPFWSTLEIAECPALLDATLAALQRQREAAA